MLKFVDALDNQAQPNQSKNMMDIPINEIYEIKIGTTWHLYKLELAKCLWSVECIYNYICKYNFKFVVNFKV